MIKTIITKLLRRRHFWRDASFSEIAELYASRMLRMIALHLSSAFLSIYLYQIGYSVLFIASFWAAYFLLKCLIALPAASFIAWLGPKHSIFISNLVFIPAMVLFAVLPQYGVWLLVPIAIFQALSTTLYTIAYSVDFSKVKSFEHAGKEIAYMNIIEKTTTSLSPLIGGILAFMFGPQFVLAIAAVLFGLAALPLMRTGEPVRRGQKLSFSGFPWVMVRRMGAAQFSIGYDVMTSGTVWSLYTAITIIGISIDSDDVYITNGILLSVILVAALGASYAFGRLIDKRRGGDLLRIASLANSLTHLARPFVGAPIAIAGLNIANEAATTGYQMAYMRGVFDNADSSGRRITYMGVLEILGNFGAAAAAGALALLVWWFGDARGMEYFFFSAAAIVLLVITARFPLYR